MKLLNLGCGSWYHPEWTNVDFTSTGKGVIAHNLLGGIPFSNESFDVVYHSHVLEHFSKRDGEIFLKECYRVLKPGGIIRVVVPDLEQIAKEYLLNLERAYNGDEMAAHNYQWIMLELYDQTVREITQGEMGKYWQQPIIPNEQYIRKRMGSEFTTFRTHLVKDISKPISKKDVPLAEKISYYFRKSTYKNKLKRMLLGNEETFYELGKFRVRGEVHKWMYDRYSLSNLLKHLQFRECTISNATNSGIKNWEKYNLDIDQGEIRKPDSLFMEARK